MTYPRLPGAKRSHGEEPVSTSINFGVSGEVERSMMVHKTGREMGV